MHVVSSLYSKNIRIQKRKGFAFKIFGSKRQHQSHPKLFTCTHKIQKQHTHTHIFPATIAPTAQTITINH